MEIHRAPGILQQLRLAAWYGLTCKLYTLSSRVEAIKMKIEVRLECFPLFSYPMIDEERLLASYGRATAHVTYRHTKYHRYSAAHPGEQYASYTL
jgi:hypothetical protein